MNRLSFEKRKQIIHLLVEGNSMRSTARIADVSFNTVNKLFLEAGKVCMRFHHYNVVNVKCQRCQADEMHSFVYSKQKNTPTEEYGTGIGDVWVYIAMDADTKLVISWYAGARSAESSNIFMNDLASRVNGRIQLTTDGYKGYLDAVDNAFKLQIDYAQQIKVYENKKGDQTDDNESDSKKHYRYKNSIKRILSGSPNPKFISTALIERQNLTVRTNVKRMTRKTNAFSKKYENHCYQLAIHYVYYNFIRLHKTLNITPAMQAGLTKRFMTLDDLVRLIEEYSQNWRD
jgi:IS1 family transposase